MKDYEFVFPMESYGNRFTKALDAIIFAINNKQCDILNLEVTKSKLSEVVQALELKMRFDLLVLKAKGKLTCNATGFELDNHKFETLDEIEKALNNKVFL